eukprot:SAG31_NODE_24281_length_485_cov_0.797927_1_plen_44_part_00
MTKFGLNLEVGGVAEGIYLSTVPRYGGELEITYYVIRRLVNGT